MPPEVPDPPVDLAGRVADLETENRRLRQLLGIDGRPSVAPPWEPTLFTGQADTTGRKVNRRSPPEERVAQLRALFRGREDVYALRWRTPEPAEVAGLRRSKVGGPTPASPTESTCR